MDNTETVWMKEALAEARLAAEEGEVPVGAVLVCQGRIVARAHNTCERDKNALRHAEMKVLDAAAGQKNAWRLSDCELYVTLEPCPMCAGALINARIGKVIYGTKDNVAGAAGSVVNLGAYPFNHRLVTEGGVMEEECRRVLQDFFKNKRNKSK